MSQSGAYGGGGSSSNYSYASSGGQSSNYNYLSFFATGSFGRRLEGQRSRDPTAPGNLEKEKRRWKWIAGAAIACMFLVNIVAAIGLSRLKYNSSSDEAGVADLQDFIQEEMKHGSSGKCQQRFRKTQVSVQVVLVVNSDDDTVVWSKKNSHHKGFNRTTPGAFVSEGVDFDEQDGRLQVQSDGIYQIHSHVSVRKLARGAIFQHEIMHHRHRYNSGRSLAEETLNRNCDTVTNGNACFSSSLLATEYLLKDDLIFVQFNVNGVKVSPKNRNFLVYDGRSTYFGFIKLGVTKVED